MLSSKYTITKTCKVVPRIITKVRLDFRDDISIWGRPLLTGSLRHLCTSGTSQTEDKHVSCKSLAQTKKAQGWCYDPTIKYEALRQRAVPKPAYYAESATDWNDSSDSEIEIETMTEEEAQVQKDKILAEAKEEQPFKILGDTETETETKTETMAEEAHKNSILAGTKDEHLFCYEPSIKYEPLKRYIVPRFAFFDSSSTDWSDSSSFSGSEAETETTAKKEAQSQEDKVLGRETTLLGWLG